MLSFHFHINEVTQDTGRVLLQQCSLQAQVKVSAVPPAHMGCPLTGSDDCEGAENSGALG